MKRAAPLRTSDPASAARKPAAGRRVKLATTKADDIPEASRRSVEARSGGYCEARASYRCQGRASHKHHRKLRRFHDHRPENLLDVCHVCHAVIHANVAAARQRGFLVRSTDVPEDVPVRPGFLDEESSARG